MKSKKSKKTVKEVYAYPLKLDLRLKAPLLMLADDNRRKINDEINLAVEDYLRKHDYAIQ